MTELACFQVDAFTDHVFGGNPAAVCPLDAWLPDAVLQNIAAENALSETAFFVKNPSDDSFHLRWFTPTLEVNLCGHATLATAFVLMTKLDPSMRKVRFQTRSGLLHVAREGGSFALDLPASPPSPVPMADAVSVALGRAPLALLSAPGTEPSAVALYATAAEVRGLTPDHAKVFDLGNHAVIVTAPGTGSDGDVDFVSRFFAPRMGVPEDPVTGSAHCALTPYWVTRLGRNTLRARQVSARGGDLTCILDGDRVRLIGQAVMVKTGTFHLA